jgi:sensor domain CHASE-containing protein
LAPNGVIRYVYPETDLELLVGSDLLRSPARRAEAYHAVVKRQLVVGGPYPVVQGGVAVVGRLPIFLPKGDGWEDFWGFAIVLVSLPELLSSSRVADLVEHGYRFEICRLAEDGDCDVFSKRGGSRIVDPIEVGVEVAQGRWLLRLEREDGWVSHSEKIVVMLGCLFLAMLATVVFYRLTRAVA